MLLQIGRFLDWRMPGKWKAPVRTALIHQSALGHLVLLDTAWVTCCTFGGLGVDRFSPSRAKGSCSQLLTMTSGSGRIQGTAWWHLVRDVLPKALLPIYGRFTWIPWNLSFCYISFHEKRLQTMLWHYNARVNSHQRWKQTRFRVCFHLWCELTSTVNVTEWQASWNTW